MNEMRLPAYARIVLLLLGIVLAVYALGTARVILIPLALSLLFALLLMPFSRWLERHGIPRGGAALLSILLILVIVAILFLFISWQVTNISQGMDRIEEQLDDFVGRVQDYISSTFGMSIARQSEAAEQGLQDLLSGAGVLVAGTFSAISSLAGYLVIVPIALYFFLAYRSFFKQFLIKVFRSHRERVDGITRHVQQVVQDYLIGLITVIVILTILNTVGLFLFGIQYAVFWGFLSSVLTIIPYFGVIIGAVPPVLFALITTGSIWIPVGLVVWFWAIQMLEGDLITPNVVGTKVSLNPFVAIVALFSGGELWGAAGLVMAIPYLAILKVICDEIEPLQPLGFLLGNPVRKRGPGALSRLIERMKRRVKRAM